MEKLSMLRKKKLRKDRAHSVNGRLICGCGSRHFRISREKVQRKVHTRTAHRKRIVAVCRNGHKTRIGFPSNLRKKK
jgi:hypothetical protein